jgi:hypothetical protein
MAASAGRAGGAGRGGAGGAVFVSGAAADSPASIAGDTTSASSRTATWSSISGSEGFVLSGAGGTRVSFAAGGFGGAITAEGGRTTVWGVMMRGAGLGTSGIAGAALATGATGLATEAAGFTGTADGGATVWRTGAAGGMEGRGAAELWTARCSTSFRTSPGLEICDKSILGLNSSGAGAVRVAVRVLLPGSACSAKYRFTRSASSTSMELECVFFSVTPTLTRTSRTALLLTSSSRARSLIRIFCCMPPCFLRVVLSGYDFIASSPLVVSG